MTAAQTAFSKVRNSRMKIVSLTTIAVIAVIVIASAANPASAKPVSPGTSSSAFTICTGQTYALCAVSSCFVLDGVAYCKCDVKSGNSISLSDKFGDGQDICTVNAEGADNGFMASTFSLPASVLSGGTQALYTCRASTSNGAYAQCDGGLCFTSTQGQSFPGFSTPLTSSEIICSCPVTVASPSTSPIGYQIAGPFPCQKSFFKNCKRAGASNKTGSTIFVGAPTGTARLLTLLLDGSVPALNRCLP